MNRTKILIVDDHPLLSAGLAMLLNAQQDLAVAGQAETPETALRLAESEQPDIVLLDISLPGKSGLELLPEVLALSPRSRVIMMTMHEEQQYLKKALDAGAKGFVLKKGVDMDLLYAIRAVVHGETYIQPSMLTSFVHAEQKKETASSDLSSDQQLWQLLSQREQEVVFAVARGHTSKEIAKKNFLSEKTVSTYRSRAMTKLGMNTRAELLDFVIRLNKLREK